MADPVNSTAAPPPETEDVGTERKDTETKLTTRYPTRSSLFAALAHCIFPLMLLGIGLLIVAEMVRPFFPDKFYPITSLAFSLIVISTMAQYIHTFQEPLREISELSRKLGAANSEQSRNPTNSTDKYP